MFTDWYELNKKYPEARDYTYAEIPQHYVWHAKDKKWKPRKLKKCIGRIVYSTPASGERYFLRMLLNVVGGAQSFTDLKMVNKINYATFKAACFAYGPLNDDKEWIHAIAKAIFWAMAPQLRDLFVTILLFYDVSRPLKLWEENWIIESMHNDRGQFCFIYGPGGTGKTFLYKTIITRLRSEQMIVLAIASSGRTAHSRFVIPLELMENNTYNIKQ
nr:hypothetical protein CTI12_AA222900 [Tanacetum cinerariifolium]